MVSRVKYSEDECVSELLSKFDAWLTLNENFQKAFYPSKEMAVDESMIKYTEWLEFPQFLPMKPSQENVKGGQLATSSEYVYRFQRYTGKTHWDDVGLDERAVWELVSPYFENL